MATTYRRIIESGMPIVSFVWHVHGYPWAVCTDEKIKALLDAGDDDARFIRRWIFGGAEIDGAYPADTVDVFPFLSHNLGSQKVKAKTPGMIDVSGWNVEIYDIPIGKSVSYLSGSDELWGLDGLHRTPNLNREAHGWGFLSGNLQTNAGAFNIVEESKVLYDRIDAVTTWKPLWIGHECIAVTDINSGTYPEYSVTIGARGLYRSKNQYHFTRPLEGFSQKIADVPGSISGHYCQLWAFPIDKNGNLYRDASDNPIFAAERSGLVSTEIGSNAGVTSVRVLGPFEGLSNEISYDITDSASMHLKKFAFSRGAAAYDWPTIYAMGQKPHLTIVEYQWYETEQRGVWYAKPIWICAPNSTRIFDTVEDVVEALNDELSKTFVGSPDSHLQLSGNTATMWRYSVTKEVVAMRKDDVFGWVKDEVKTRPMWYLKQETGGGDKSIATLYSEGLTDEEVRFVFGKWSEVSGVLQLVLGLGIPHNPMANWISIYMNNGKNGGLDCWCVQSPMGEETSFGGPLWDNDTNIQQGGYRLDNEAQFMNLVYRDREDAESATVVNRFSVSAGLCQQPQVYDFDAPEDYFVAKYFYQWDWVNYPVPDSFTAGGNAGTPVYTKGVLHTVFDSLSGEDSFFIEDDSITDMFPIGSIVRIGQYTGEVEIFGTSSGSKYMRLVDSLVTDKEETAFIGSFLCCIPAHSLDSDQDYYDHEQMNESWEESDDPFSILLARHSSSAPVTDIIKAFLGYTDISVTIPIHERRLWIPFFRTDSDDGFVSQIDWDNLSALLTKYCTGSLSLVPSSSFNLLKALDEELKLYGVSMCEDWDDTNRQSAYRFREFGDAVSSETLMRGRVISESELVPESVAEDHNDAPMYNSISVSYRNVMTGEENVLNYKNQDVFSLVQRDQLRMDIKPVFTRFLYDSDTLAKRGYADGRLRPILNRASEIKPVQKRTVLISSRYRTSAGRETLVTDPAAHNPQTHRTGIVSASCFIVEQSVDLTKGIVKVSYLVSGDSEIHGYAPSCRFDVSDITTEETGFTVVPEDRYGCTIYKPKDIFFFDCFDLSDENAPFLRDSDSDDYAVTIYFQDYPISADNPIFGTCEVFDNSGTWTLRVFCDESKIPAGGNVIVTFGSYDDCEPCQKPWLFFSDENGDVGTVSRRGDTWK